VIEPNLTEEPVTEEDKAVEAVQKLPLPAVHFIEGVEVFPWNEEPYGRGKPSQIVLRVRVKDSPDYFITHFLSREPLDTLVNLIKGQTDIVFGVKEEKAS
jgi:hypothetical protein